MKRTVIAAIFALILFTTITACYADRGDWHSGIRERIQVDRQRIERGIYHGSLTRFEADRLYRELDYILDEIDRMRMDGHLDMRERERIHRDLDRLDRDIMRERHDNERRRRY